jgi:hypothetical protein
MNMLRYLIKAINNIIRPKVAAPIGYIHFNHMKLNFTQQKPTLFLNL